MTSDLDMEGESPSELRRRRGFQIRMWIGSGLFVLTFFALSAWGHQPTPWRWVLVVLPLIPFVWMVAATVLRVRQMDEYQVKLFFPGLAVGFVVAMLVSVVFGVLSSAGFAVPNGGWLICIAGVLSWQITNLFTGAPHA
ncbi:MAG: hypothetical protein LBE60_11230 [Microbacterium sp.]|uniref:hypothetical protein n=1 Tax=Microbacterium sp. TaxID=51671 RepID=UPI002828B481|nr:hypothetical protein [Microbacterium sp.]MDR2322205.1 hypothetical protein [Microbacterium sp.]